MFICGSHKLIKEFSPENEGSSGFSNSPSGWTTWEEYLASKPGEFTPDQIVSVTTQNQLKVERTVARILEMFDWYSTSRLVAIIGHFKHWVGADCIVERWRQTLLDFCYQNICFNLKQLINVLHCDLQVTIHQGLAEVQADILKMIGNFVDNFHIEVTILSAPQVHTLLDHLWSRCASSHAFLAAIKWGTTLTWPESWGRVPHSLSSLSLTDSQTTRLTLNKVWPL